MKTDFYTKSILTIIAVCLLYISFGKKPTEVQAATSTQCVITGIKLNKNINENSYLPVGIAATNLRCSDQKNCGWDNTRALPVQIKNE